MPVKLTEKEGAMVLEVEVVGKLTHVDYQSCVAEFERLVRQHGKLRVLYDMKNFQGWSTAAFWDEIKFDVKHLSDIERMALVGDTAWEKWMAEFTKPFTRAEVRYFEHDQFAAARAWV